MGTNLGAHVGDVVTLSLPGRGGPVRVRVTGIVNIVRADALFQPTDPRLRGAAFTPPVDVVVMPYDTFARTLRARLARAVMPASGAVQQGGPALVEQVHLALKRNALPDDPAAAQLATLALRRDIEKAFPGQLQVADNVGDSLDVAPGRHHLGQGAGGLPGAARRGRRRVPGARGGGGAGHGAAARVCPPARARGRPHATCFSSPRSPARFWPWAALCWAWFWAGSWRCGRPGRRCSRPRWPGCWCSPRCSPWQAP